MWHYNGSASAKEIRMPPVTIFIIVGIVLVGISVALVQDCGAVMANGYRCRRTRRGLGNRCQDHGGITLHDILSIAAFLLGVGAIILWFANDGLDALLSTL